MWYRTVYLSKEETLMDKSCCIFGINLGLMFRLNFQCCLLRYHALNVMSVTVSEAIEEHSQMGCDGSLQGKLHVIKQSAHLNL
jgi:hypothetical protein